MSEEDYHAIRWVDENIATRKTKEVNLRCEITNGGTMISLTGFADLEHHLVEDSAILLKKMCEKKCGADHA